MLKRNSLSSFKSSCLLKLFLRGSYESRPKESLLSIFTLSCDVNKRVYAITSVINSISDLSFFDKPKVICEYVELVQVWVFKVDMGDAGQLDLGEVVGDCGDSHVRHDGFS